MAWQADYSHASIQFSAKHMMISSVRGQFEKFTVNADINEQDVTQSKLEVLIDAASVNTKFEQRDNHLRSPDFFHAKEYPYLVFKSKRGVKVDEAHGKLIGDLTIRDITKEVTLDVEFLGRAKSPWGTESAGFTATTKVNRKDWNLNWNVGLEAGGWLVGDDVTINIEIEFTKVPEAVPAPVEDKQLEAALAD
jgi:polyisoprenoid-binding protein YceI